MVIFNSYVSHYQRVSSGRRRHLQGLPRMSMNEAAEARLRPIEAHAGLQG